jgi:hypothetical protein
MTLVLLESASQLPGIANVFINQPQRIIQCDAASEVDDLLAEVEKWTKQGYTAFGFITYEAAYAFLTIVRTTTINSPLRMVRFIKDFQKTDSGKFHS